jgi:hypothetical protein
MEMTVFNSIPKDQLVLLSLTILILTIFLIQKIGVCHVDPVNSDE